MKSLYRRYRPLALSDVVGQEQVTKPLENALKNGRISHAYLFIGPRGCGKTSVARIFAHQVNGFKYELEDDYVDIIEIDGASNRGIDNIRDLREKAMIAPTKGKYKIYIIDEVHMLTKEAFNALLKTLEEPPSHVIFIMATTDAYKVPITITSRAQSYTFKLADDETMFKFLRRVADQEKIKIDDGAIKIIVRRGGGSFRDSLSLLDQISTLSNKEIDERLVTSALGLPEDEKIMNLLSAYQAKSLNDVSKCFKDLLLSGIKPETLAEEMILRIVADPQPVFFPLLDKLPDIKPPFAEARLLVALTDGIHASIKSPEPSSDHKPKSVTTPKSAAMPKPPTISKPNALFSWDDFIAKVQELNDAVYAQLVKCQHSFLNNELEIFPEKKIIKTILVRDNNMRILTTAASGVKITIHDAGDTPSGEKKDAMLTKISDIMGGEVKNDAGGNPF
ncbi:DNA polymerase III subunit gamma/tau [Candidatus Saccharibacteria bacterium]|nr:DNA polymerase III subunit gamma/tau [Candidatus Saccharibacteria bacterium]